MVIKSPEAFRTISEVANVLDVPPHVLRFWETRFTQVKPVKRGGGRRYYRPQDVQLLRGIRGLLYDDGLTIKGAQKVLREKGTRHVVDLGTVDDPETAVDAETMQDGASPADSHPVAAEAPDAPAPQQDLFNCPAEPSSGVEKPASHPTDSRKEKLKSVLRELEALRAVMLKDVT